MIIRMKATGITEDLLGVYNQVMKETMNEKIARANKDYPAGLQCTTPMGTPFTSNGIFISDAKGNIFTSNWEFVYSATYDEWATIDKDQQQPDILMP